MKENILEMKMFLDEALSYSLCVKDYFKDGSKEKHYINNFRCYNTKEIKSGVVLKLWSHELCLSYILYLTESEIKNIKINDNLLQLEKEYVTITIEII